mmetsp:Transcript_42119/g.105993  ORF Transcript_42119/g.105993 Transcript_42119/m.105993 type:complete len:103 (-) Transcript_42119:81-389(-)
MNSVDLQILSVSLRMWQELPEIPQWTPMVQLVRRPRSFPALRLTLNIWAIMPRKFTMGSVAAVCGGQGGSAPQLGWWAWKQGCQVSALPPSKLPLCPVVLSI